MLVLVLDCTQCLPQAAGTPPAMMRGRMTGLTKKLGLGPPERQDKVDTICTVPLVYGTPTTRRLYPFGATYNAQRMLHRNQDPQDMETIHDYRHTQARERLLDSEELLTILPLMPYVQTLRTKDS